MIGKFATKIETNFYFSYIARPMIRFKKILYYFQIHKIISTTFISKNYIQKNDFRVLQKEKIFLKHKILPIKMCMC